MTIGRRLAAMVLAGSVAACAGVAHGAELPAKDWPEFHGPARDNVSRETGLLQEWPKDGPPLAWKVKGVGNGFSSVSVAGGKIYTAGDAGGESFVFALNEADGAQVWKAKLGKAGGGGGYPGPRATPTVDGERVYMIGQYSDVVAYETTGGKEVWRKNLDKEFKGHMMSGWGNSESVLVDGDNLICTPGGKGGTVLALNKNTGATVWRSKEFTDAAAYSSPIVATIGGVRQIVILTNESVAGISPADGSVLWKAARPGQTAVIPTPIVSNDHVYVTSGYGDGCDLFKITAEGKAFNATKVWSNKNMVNHHGGVILFEGNVYGYSEGKGWVCQDFMTGKIKWKDKTLDKGTISFADGRFYLREEKGDSTVALIEASPTAFKETGSFAQPERSGREAWPHLVIANGKLYVRDQGLLLCYNVKK